MTAGGFATIRVKKDDGIAWLHMNRPERRNAMNPRMHFGMDAAPPGLEAGRGRRRRATSW